MNTESPPIKIWPPVVYLSTLAAGVILHLFTPLRIFPQAWIGHVIGWPVLVIGAVLVAWGKRTMDRAGVNPRFKPVNTLVSTGPFTFTRNPLYLGTNLMFAGIALVVNALWILVFLLPTVIYLHLSVIPREEGYLERLFSDEYRQYRERVRRWL